MTKTLKTICGMFFASLLCLLAAMTVSADNLSAGSFDYFLDQKPVYTAENGNELMIIDEAELINDKSALTEVMKPLLEYGNVMFLSCSEGCNIYYDSYEFSGEVLSGYYTNANNSTVFFIDMDMREIYIRTYGDISDVITDSKSEVITDNCYTYASDQNYDECALQAFEQMYKVLSGQRIAAPMHYIGAGLISVIIAMIICFIVISRTSTARKAGDNELMEGTDTSIMLTDVQSKYLKTIKTKTSSGSGSGSGSSSSGGGFFSGSSGGSSSSGGSGGGHSF